MEARITPPDWWCSPELDDMDRRTRKTHMALFGALAALLREKPLRAITVTELTRAADVNRSTFYAHFQDIRDLFVQMKRNVRSTVRQLADDEAEHLRRGEFRPMLRLIYAYFGQNREAFEFLREDVDGASLAEEIVGVLVDSYREAIGGDASDGKQGRLLAQGISFCAGGTANMLSTWLDQGCLEDADTMADRNARLIGATSSADLMEPEGSGRPPAHAPSPHASE